MIWVWWVLVYGLALYGAGALARDIGNWIDKSRQEPLPSVEEAYERALRETSP